MCKSEFAIGQPQENRASIVGTAVSEAARGVGKKVGRDRSPAREDAKNSTHILEGLKTDCR